MTSMLLFDTSSFVLKLSQRLGREFHAYRELCTYLFKIFRLCIKPNSPPEETDLPGIHNLVTVEAQALPVTDFVARFKLYATLATATKHKAEREREREREKV